MSTAAPHPGRVLPGRLPEHEAYPAGEPGLAVAWLTLGDGERVRVVTAGPADGAPVVFLHGWGCAAYVWRRNVPALAEAGFRVLVPELRGHGFSDKPLGTAPYTVAALTDFVVAVLDALHVGRAVLVGHSMSGALAARVAATHPERVGALALLAPVGGGRVRWGPFPWIPVMRLLTPASTTWLLPHLVGRWAIAGVLALAYGGANQFGGREVREFWAPSRFPAFAYAMRALLHAFDWRPFDASDWRRLAPVPTLLAFGTRDRFVDGSEMGEVRRLLPHARTEWVAGAGHILPEESAALLNPMLVALARAGSAASARSA